MAGVVKGNCIAWPDSTISVVPDACPVEDPHRQRPLQCYTTYPDGEQRACPYWTATTSPSNYSDRQHPSALRQRAVGLGARRIQCQILCQRQRANRPPGA